MPKMQIAIGYIAPDVKAIAVFNNDTKGAFYCVRTPTSLKIEQWVGDIENFEIWSRFEPDTSKFFDEDTYYKNKADIDDLIRIEFNNSFSWMCQAFETEATIAPF